MSFHPEKCQVIHVCSNRRYRQRRQYTLHGHILESVDSAKYLGVHLSQDMTWQTHVNRTAAKASSTLDFSDVTSTAAHKMSVKEPRCSYCRR